MNHQHNSKDCFASFSMRSIAGWLLILACLFSAKTAAEQTGMATEIYQPDHKTTANLLETIKSLYPHVRFAIDDNRLIIRAAPATVDAVIELLLQLDQPERLFSVEFRRQIPGAKQKVVSTAPREIASTRFRIYENKPLELFFQQQSQQLASYPWLTLTNRASAEQVITVKLQAAREQVFLDVIIQKLEGGQLSIINQQLSGMLNEWQPVAIDQPEQPGQKQWGTSRNTLFVKVIELGQ